ncbi:OprO/OprP family phosphate-selective porin [Candidatus Methylopumilus universalis]|uniref:OprO/OprP family phosphate-selective porin n=1 Tax=Candidatus Methylopumilus universalis TaxID=2588536 RepID=UPI001120359C|nr:porin [Candidatus Methylopumilus universalis]QDC80455.1 hypothetical protein FIT83_04630 [Candidatus Methylopumilus universalis]QDC81756.1 hypothetical protein FIT82_04695 [Candidatus Methylopumilus universalis]QDC88198.1 hypothetical protein FIT81_04710 [Candidatus Methylopumilus universalis]
MNFNKKLAVAVSGALLLMAGQVAFADSATDIVDALVSKGVLTEEEGKLITKGHTSKTAVTPVVKEKDGAFTLESANGRNSVQLTGRMHFDYRHINIPGLADNTIPNYSDKDTASGADQFELRRARIGVKGKLAKYFNYEAVLNMPGTATVDVAYMDFAKYDQVQFRFGKFKQPFGLEQLTSSNNIDFQERSYVDQHSPGKRLGTQVMGELRPGITYAASAYQFNDTENDYQSENMSYAGRATTNFAEIVGNKEMIMHVGLSGFENSYSIRPTSSSQDAGSTTTTGTFMSYRTPGRGLSNIFRAQINGGTMGGTWQSATSDATAMIDSKALGLEGILASGPFKIQGEYTDARYKANYQNAAVSAVGTDAYYVEALWLLTGEKYADAYKKGVFGSIKPKKDFDLDNYSGLGAWELGLKYEAYSVYDAHAGSEVPGSSSVSAGTRFQGNLDCNGTNSAAATGNSSQTANGAGGKNGCTSGATTYTAGIKWILNPNMRVLMNYQHTKFDNAWNHFDVGGGSYMKYEDLVSVRGQWAF